MAPLSVSSSVSSFSSFPLALPSLSANLYLPALSPAEVSTCGPASGSDLGQVALTQAGLEVRMEGGEEEEDQGETPEFQYSEINPSVARRGQPAISLPFPPRS